MIIEALFGLLTGIINLIPFSLPGLPDGVQDVIDFIFEGILGSLGLIDMFIDLRLWISLAVALTVIFNIKHIWNLFIFCINLIPSVNVSYWK